MRGGILSHPFLYFYLSMISMNLICWSIAATAVMLTDSVVAAQALVPVYNAANILFSGYLMSKKDIPYYLQWLMVTSTVTRPFIGISINEMESQIFDCTNAERVPFLDDPLLNVSAPSGFNNGHYRACPIQTGEDALKYLYGLDAEDYQLWHLLATSVGYFLLFQILLSITIACIDHSTTVSDDPASKMIQSGGEREQEQEQRGVHVHVVQQDENNESNFSGVGTELQFRNISYTINIGKGSGSESMKTILTDVSGIASPGSVVALMGPSGAGKTTLLDVIAGRKTGGKVNGEILLNGRPKDDTFSRYAGYCEQMDSHMPTLTVREALSVSAALRLDESGEERERHVARVLEQLLLVGYQDQLLGTPGIDGVAPEVRKLVTIGVELVCKPQVLFLDEPTTGLDSSSALATMMYVVHK